MPDSQADREVKELVDFLVRKRVSKQMLKEIVRQVEDVEHQELLEKRNSRVLLPALVLLAIVISCLLVLNLVS